MPPVISKPICPIFDSQKQVSFHSPESIVTERKFDTALRRSQVENFYKRINEDRITLDDKILLHSLKKERIDPCDTLIDDACYYRFLLPLLNRKEPARKISANDVTTVKRAWEACKTNLKCQVGYMTQQGNLSSFSDVKRGLDEYFDSKHPNNTVNHLIIACTKLSTMVENLGLLQGIKKYGKTEEEYVAECCKVNKWKDEGLCLTCWWSGRLCAIQLNDGRIYILPRAYLLLMHNKECDLISVMICSACMSGVSTSPDFEMTIIRFVREFCRLNIQYQSKFYTIAKSLESLVVGRTLRLVDSWDNKEFYNSLVDELELSIGYMYEGSKLQEIVESVDIASQHELACLSKIVGHPLVSIRKGAETLFSKTTESYTLDRVTLAKCECHIKVNYIRNHIVREKKWPPCYLTSGMVHPAIKAGWAQNQDPYHIGIREKYGTPDILDFQQVSLAPNIKYSKLENTIPYLKDKTISLLRSKVIINYLQKAVENWDDVESYSENWKETRLLLYYLMNPTSVLNHDTYIDMYANSADLEDLMDYLVIRCVPKEKELKIDPRFFGCKTYEERFRSLSQEKNAMKFLELYCDEQAMTLSELELARRLISFRRLRMAYKDHVILYIVVDASSWNNHFRSETVDDLMIETAKLIWKTRKICSASFPCL